MTGNWLLKILFLIYPLVVIGFNRFIRNCIPCKRIRKDFLLENEYVNKLLYLFMPVLVLHLELMLHHSGYPFDEINVWILVILAVLQIYLFVTSVVCLVQFFGIVREFGQQQRE